MTIIFFSIYNMRAYDTTRRATERYTLKTSLKLFQVNAIHSTSYQQIHSDQLFNYIKPLNVQRVQKTYTRRATTVIWNLCVFSSFYKVSIM